MSDLEQLHSKVEEFNKNVCKKKINYIGSRTDKQLLETIVLDWRRISKSGLIEKQTADALTELMIACEREISKAHPLKKQVCKTLKEFSERYYQSVLLDHRTQDTAPIKQGIREAVSKLESSLSGSLEKRYFEEAKGCANNAYCRSFIVISWSIVMYRLYQLIQKSGFADYERAYLAAYPKSRFSLTSLDDFFDVSDNNVITVAASKSIVPHIIDKHQKEVLLRNSKLRNMCAHVAPNYTPTEPTVMVFVDELVDSFLSVKKP